MSSSDSTMPYSPPVSMNKNVIWTTFIVYLMGYLIISWLISIYSEKIFRANHKNNNLESYVKTCYGSLGEWREYYWTLYLHYIHDAFTISSWLVLLYHIEYLDKEPSSLSTSSPFWENLRKNLISNNNINEYLMLFLSFSFFALYRIASTIDAAWADLFNWKQVIYQLLDLNMCYELHLMHSTDKKSSILHCLFKQHVYMNSLPQLLIHTTYFLYLYNNSQYINDTNFITYNFLLLNIIFAIIYIWMAILNADKYCFLKEGTDIFSHAFRLRFSYRSTEIGSRILLFGLAWIFLGNFIMFFLTMGLLVHCLYAYLRGFLKDDYYNIIANLFVVPNMSVGLGSEYLGNYIALYPVELVVYGIVYFGCCFILPIYLNDKDVRALDIITWTHFWEDTIAWILIFIYRGENINNDKNDPDPRMHSIFDRPLYLAIFILAFIFCIYRMGYYCMLRSKDYFEHSKQILTLKNGLLSFALSKQWPLLLEFLPRVKNTCLNRKDYNSGDTILHIAIKENQWNVVEELIAHNANVDIPNRQRISPLHLIISSASLKDVKLLELFLTLTKHFNSKTIENKNILHLTCKSPSSYIPVEKRFELIFGKKDPDLDVNLKDNLGNTPLHYAVELNNLKVIEMLIEHGAKLDIANLNGQVPLHTACDKFYYTVGARALLSHGANINAQQTINKWTPMHIAASIGSKEMAELLLDFLPDLTIKNSDNQTALELARARGYDRVGDVIAVQCNEKPVLTNNNNNNNNLAITISGTTIKEEEDKKMLLELYGTTKEEQELLTKAYSNNTTTSGGGGDSGNASVINNNSISLEIAEEDNNNTILRNKAKDMQGKIDIEYEKYRVMQLIGANIHAVVNAMKRDRVDPLVINTYEKEQKFPSENLPPKYFYDNNNNNNNTQNQNDITISIDSTSSSLQPQSQPQLSNTEPSKFNNEENQQQQQQQNEEQQTILETFDQNQDQKNHTNEYIE